MIKLVHFDELLLGYCNPNTTAAGFKQMQRVPLNIRIDHDLRAQLWKIAISQNLSLSNFVENELKQVVEEFRLTDLASRSSETKSSTDDG
jgi:uncharacterized protein (DUF1778 family)